MKPIQRTAAILLVLIFTAVAYVSCGGGDSEGGSGTAYVNPATAGYKELGCGTDVFDEYACENNVKGKVLDVDALNDLDYLVLNTSVQEGMIQRVSGTNVSEYATELGITVGLQASYMWFSTSIKSAFTDNTYRRSEYSYVTLMERHYKNSLKVVNTKWDAAYLRDYLTPEASKAINDIDPQKKWSPEDVIATFGTHVMLGVFTGARLDYNLSINITDVSHQTDLQSYAEMKAGTKFASASFTSEVDQSTYTAMSSYDQKENILAKGGDEQYARPGDDTDYQQWKASIDSNPCLVGIIRNALVPIWELAEDSARAESIHNYFIEYADGKVSEFDPLTPMIITGIEVTENIPSTLTGYLPLMDISGEATKSYVNKGVSSVGTPTRQSDRIMEATKVWISYKAVESNQTLDSPVTGLHLFTSDSASALAEDLNIYGPHEVSDVDFNTDTCQTATWWHTTPCPTSWCAYDCDNVACSVPNTKYRFLHYLTSDTDTPIKTLVLGDNSAINASLDFNVRKNHIWWGPQDLNNDGQVDDTDAQLVLSGVVWIDDGGGGLMDLNEDADNYYVYDYECPWGCCWVKTSITDAPPQYLGYVSY